MIVIVAAFVFVIGAALFGIVASTAVSAGLEMLLWPVNALVWISARWALKAEVKEQFAPAAQGPPFGIYVFHVLGEPRVRVALHACSRRCAERLLPQVQGPRRIEACEGPSVCDFCRQPFR
jgi:hypothetical protein